MNYGKKFILKPHNEPLLLSKKKNISKNTLVKLSIETIVQIPKRK